MADAVVIGSGPNGLVAANLLADAGWDVLVLEAAPDPGGAVRSDEGVAPGFVSDVFSAFYPLAARSPAFRGLDLERYGLRWSHAPSVLAHVTGDSAAVLSRDPAETAASVDAFHPGDGDAWLRLYGLWQRIGDDLLEALLTPFPPVRPAARLLRELRVAGALRLARFGVLPVRRLGEEEFGGAGGPLLLAGNTLHTDLSPEAAAGSVFGWLLSMLGQSSGFPVPVGGAGQLTAALVRRFQSKGGRIECAAEVTEIVVRGGRAVAVRTRDGREADARRAVLADVVAPRLYGGLVDWAHLPAGMRDDQRRFQWDFATVKVDWALDAPVPWTASGARGAGTVHVAEDMDALTRFCAQIATGTVPDRPFLIAGQMTTADATRSPAGTESMWAYTHVPRTVKDDPLGEITGSWDDRDSAAIADRVERRIEELAPGFRALIRGRRVLTPPDLERRNPNLVGGGINGGTSAIHQQLVFRPLPGLGRPETPVAGLYLASSSAHPGGGVHGACGANAARAALREQRGARGVLTRPVVRAAQRAVRGPDR